MRYLKLCRNDLPSVILWRGNNNLDRVAVEYSLTRKFRVRGGLCTAPRDSFTAPPRFCDANHRDIDLFNDQPLDNQLLAPTRTFRNCTEPTILTSY